RGACRVHPRLRRRSRSLRSSWSTSGDRLLGSSYGSVSNEANVELTAPRITTGWSGRGMDKVPLQRRGQRAAHPERWIATPLEAERIFRTSCGIEVEKNSPSIIVESVRGSRNGIPSLNHCVLPASAEALECVGSSANSQGSSDLGEEGWSRSSRRGHRRGAASIEAGFDPRRPSAVGRL